MATSFSGGNRYAEKGKGRLVEVTRPDGTKMWVDEAGAQDFEAADRGLTQVTKADGTKIWVDQAGANDIAESNAAAAPPDTYAATLRELARARTQRMIRDTNGLRGSAAGAGLGIPAAPTTNTLSPLALSPQQRLLRARRLP